MNGHGEPALRRNRSSETYVFPVFSNLELRLDTAISSETRTQWGPLGATMAELDHVFLLLQDPAPVLAQLQALGLHESYRRAHPGQGTRNVCFAFDNAYLEILWIDALQDTQSPAISRCQFQARRDGGCAVGIAWRGELDLPTWSFEPPYLPQGMHIPVALDSDSAEQPLMFRSPGDRAPSAWPKERRGIPQPWSRLVVESVGLPTQPSLALRTMQAQGLIEGTHGGRDLRLSLEGDGKHRLTLRPGSAPRP